MPSEDVRYIEDCSVWKTTFVWKLKNKQTYKQTNSISSTIRPGNSDPFYTVSYYIYMGHYLLDIQYYIKWVTTSWTHSTVCPRTLDSINYYSMSRKEWPILYCKLAIWNGSLLPGHTVYVQEVVASSWTHGSLVQFYIVSNDLKWIGFYSVQG